MERRPRLPATVGLALAVVLIVGGNAWPASAESFPRAMASTGDSITRAFNTGLPFFDNPQSSWSTGTDPLVQSHYSRLLALDPTISGRSFNHASSGARMADLHDQMLGVNARGVDYVTVLMGGNDVCTSSEAAMTTVADFRAQFARAMQTITTGSPTAKIFVISIPDTYNLWSILKDNASARGVWEFFGICGSMLADPLSTTAAANERRARVRQRNADFNTQLAEVCAVYAQCRFDGYAAFNTPFTVTDVSTLDYFHPSLAGLAKLSAVSWSLGYWAQSTPSIGGRALRLTAQGGLSWSGGGVQAGYLIARFSEGATSILPAAGPLPPTAVSFVDATAPAGLACYMVLPVGPSEVLGTSDLLCMVQGLASGSVPPDFSVGLVGSNATLRWNAPGTQEAYLLATLGGSQQVLDAAATSASIAIAAPSCFVLYAVSGGAVLGNTDMLCAFPGFSSLGAAGAAWTPAGPAIDGALDTLTRPLAEVRSSARRAAEFAPISLPR